MNPYTVEVLEPKSSVSANFTTLAVHAVTKKYRHVYEPQRDRTFDPQIKSLLLYQLS